ncbi:type VI secretion system baseplate subunit TssE [Rhodospira trueperi]|jgi:type VI secretion system protein ImpF|uniref:Type VI secretion system protein ImpF n=1 Tax=Rhodospira trueperi TaxID=69960 RepID=A0A1G7G6E6_9PROT|nr:type VI secretion system baseplate subunit TssE [Rhodospira trueperi]SDE83677.1 type VI secretion system protein ImpF [Rhodospira trueperi]
MAYGALKQPPLPSVLDRLHDDDDDMLDGRSTSVSRHLEALRRSVRRDLEMLLNTRHRCLSPPPDLDELRQSVVNYGIPDFTGEDMAAEEHREALRKAVEETVRRYEPRFIQVSVSLADEGEPLDRSLCFRIEALMRAYPSPEPVIFDSVLDPVTRGLEVRNADHG